MQNLEEKFFEKYNIPSIPADTGFERLKEYDKIEFKHVYPEIDEHKLLQLICISKTIPDEYVDDVLCWNHVPNIYELKEEILQKLISYAINYTDDNLYKKVREVFHV